MNNLKKAKPKRLLSLLLTVVMLLGTIPFAALPVGATDAPDWITISGGGESSKMQQLIGMLSQSGTKYIKLGADIDLDYDLGCAFPINGVKHLDLNGHIINYNNASLDTRQYMFEIQSGAELYIYDSSAKQTGYIHYDGHFRKDLNICRIVFVVKGGGKLVVNGGEIEAGRSKQVWLVASGGFYNGYARKQIAGTAIYIRPNGECVINGGTIRGRGSGGWTFRVDDSDAMVRHSAIFNMGTLTVNDGFIKGMGGADAIAEPKDNNNAKTTVYSGVLDTHKVDVETNAREDKHEYGEYGNSVTGAEIAHRTVDYTFAGKADDDRSRRTWNIYGTSGKTAGECFKIQSGSGALPSAWNPKKPFYVKVGIGTQSGNGEYNPYYTYEAAKAIAEDYNNQTAYQSIINWALYDSNGNKVSEINRFPKSANAYNHLSKMTAAELRVNMQDFKTESDGAISWKLGQKYTLRCTVSEIWNGQNNWEITNFDEWNFAVTNWDTASLSLNAGQASTSTGNTADITVTASASSNISDLYNQVWSYGYYGTVNGKYQPVWQAQNNGDTVYTYKNLPAGPQRLCTNIFGQSVDGLYQNINATTNVLVMPQIAAKEQYGGIYGSWSGYESYSGNSLKVSFNEAMVRLKAIDTNLLKDPVSGNALVFNGKTVDGNSIKWQRWNSSTQKWENINSNSEDTGSTDVTGVYLTEDTDGDGSRCILETNRTGTYRAYISCYGKTWYSSAPFKVVSKDYTAADVYKVSAATTYTTTEYNDGNKINFTVNSTDAEWGTWSAGLIVKKDGVPEGAWKYFNDTEGATEYQTSYFSRNNTTGVSKEVSFYATSTVGAFWRMSVNEGIIPGKYTFIPVAKAQNGTEVKGEPFTITVEKAATGADILANYLNVTNGGGESTSDVPTYTLPENTKNITFRAQKIQSNATLPRDATVRWNSSNAYVATIDYNTGKFEAKQPGTTRITMTYEGSYNGRTFNYTRYLDVVVPIAEFKFGEVDWANAAKNDKKYSELTMPITQVRSYDGDWIADNGKYMEAVCTQGKYLDSGVTFSANKTVEYNQSVQVQFKVAPKEGYRFPLKPILDSSNRVDGYVADTNSIITHAVGSTAMDTALKLGYNFTSGYGDQYNGDDWFGYHKPSFCGITVRVDQPCIKNPNVRYVDTVSITTAEPIEGDSRYQGDAEDFVNKSFPIENMMDVKVLTMMSENAPITVSKSVVNKISDLKGSGVAYEPISYDDFPSNQSEYGDVLYPGGNKADTVKKLTAPRYEAATYYHDLTLNADGTGVDGREVAFDPDVKLFVNGRPVKLIINNNNGTGSGYTAKQLHVRYYYVSDPSPAFTKGTVSGLTAPVTGATPVAAEDLTVSAVRSDSTVDDSALYVSRLTWYADTNGNGKADEGEDNDALAADGTFKSDTVYIAYIELAANENMGRIDNLSFQLILDRGSAGTEVLNTTQANGSYRFAKTDPPPGVTVSGTATSFGSDGEKVKIELIKSGNTSADYSTEITGKSTAYSIPAVESGTYTLRVSKKNHVTRDYTVTVGTTDITQDVKIQLLGDVTGDGIVNAGDISRVYAHVSKTNALTGYELLCADVTFDSVINAGDISRLYAHVSKVNPLW